MLIMQKAKAIIENAGWSPFFVAAIIAWVSALSSGFIKDDGWGTPGIVEIVFAFVLTAVIYLGLLLLIQLLNRFSIISNTQKTSETDKKQTFFEDVEKQDFVIGQIINLKTAKRALLLFICWLPATIALLPGVLFNDTIFQLGQYFGNSSYGVFSMQEGASFTDHHPIFVTFVFGAIINLGMFITGSSTAGLFGLVVLQVTITAFTLAVSCTYLENLGVKRLVMRIVLAIYALFPLFPIMANIVVKETFFAWIYVWFFLFVIEYIRSKGATFKKPGMAFAFILSCLLMMLTKKTSLYLVVLTAFVLAVVYRKALITLFVSILLPLITSVVLIPAIVYPLFNVSPGSSVEVFGALYQQTARYVIENPNDVTAEEREIIDELLGYDYIAERYYPFVIDNIKGIGFLEGVEYWPTSDQLQRYLKCYVSQGLRHPESYIRAVGAINGKWFVNENYSEGNPNVFDWLSTNNDVAVGWYEDVPHYDRPEVNKLLTKGLARLDVLVAQLPVISFLFTPAFYVFVVPLISFMLILKGQKRYLGLIVPVFVSFLFLLVSPSTGALTEAFRYAIPFIYTTPILCIFAVFMYQKSRQFKEL